MIAYTYNIIKYFYYKILEARIIYLWYITYKHISYYIITIIGFNILAMITSYIKLCMPMSIIKYQMKTLYNSIIFKNTI